MDLEVCSAILADESFVGVVRTTVGQRRRFLKQFLRGLVQIVDL